MFPDLPAPASKTNNPLIDAEVELHTDSGAIPVPAAAVVQTGTQGAKPESSPVREEMAWIDDAPPRQVYRVVDVEGYVVLQIPSEQVIEVAKQIDSTLKQEDDPRGLDVRT
jgi:hypothetical protein